MAIRTYKVTLDSKNTIAPEPVFLRQGDKTGAVVIDATLMDNGAPVSIDGLTPIFKANTADGQAVISDTTGFSIVNASGGEFTYQVPSQLSSVPGKIKIAYFSLTDQNGGQSTFNIVFSVFPAADMTQDSAKDWVSNLNEIIDQYNHWVNDAHSSWQEFVNANKEIIESIDPGGTLLEEIIAARNGKSNLKTRLDDEYTQVTEQLAQTAKLNRKFKPKITSSTWYVNGGTLTKDPDEEILNDIDNVKKMGVDGISYTCHVYEDENTQKLYIAEGEEDTFNMVYSKCLELDLSVNVIKFHCTIDVINSYTGDFKADYKDLILRMCEVAQGKVKYFTVLNEVPKVYFNPSYQSFVIDLLSTVKSYGFKAGITQMGELDLVQIVDNEWIVPHIDAVFMNYYPSISFKGSESSYEDSLEAWNIVRSVDLIKRKYKLPFIISETGVMPFWECLSNPGTWNWSGIVNTSGKGYPEVYPLYLYGLLNSNFVNQNIDEVWLWYGERAYTPQTNNLINSYTGGVQYV